MKIFRSILPLILVLVTTLLVSCGSPTASAPPTYTPEKLQKIETYRIPVDIAQQRLSKLGKLIDEEDWVDTESFIHGPLGLIRRDMTYLSNALLPEDQTKATELAKDIFRHFEDIDMAAKNNDYQAAIREYKEVVSDFDLYLQLIPNAKGTA
ncbi:MAG: photosystem II protein PsbQ [Pleurocapsa sp.]